MPPSRFQAIALCFLLLESVGGLKTKSRFPLESRFFERRSSLYRRIRTSRKPITVLGDHGVGHTNEMHIGDYNINVSAPKGHIGRRKLKGKKEKVHHGHFFHGKGKGKESSEKGKGKGGKGGSSSKGKKTADNRSSLPSVCSKLDFRSYYSSPDTRFRNRLLQFEGDSCEGNALDMARYIPELSIFVGLVEAAHLEDIFRCAGPFTVMAPTNDAFASNQAFVDFLSTAANVGDLRTILLYHMLPGLYLSESFEEGSIPSLQGDSVTISLSPLSVDQAQVASSDVISCNGVIQVVTKVLTPRGTDFERGLCDLLDFGTDQDFESSDISVQNILEKANGIPSLSTFVELIEIAGLSELFHCPGPFTLLAPSNSALAKIDTSTLEELLMPENREKLQNLLLYHFLPGLNLYAGFETGLVDSLLDGMTVEVSTGPVVFNYRSTAEPIDNVASNGNIILIDEVLIPEPEVCSVFDATSDDRRNLQIAATGCSPNVLESARKIQDLSLTVTLLENANLLELFQCAGPLTALLPTNAAWASLDTALFEFILRPDNAEILEDVLLYHLLPGKYLTADFGTGSRDTLLATEKVDTQSNPIRVNNVEVGTRDIESCNGVIHSIRDVLLPFALDAGTPAPAPLVTSYPTAYLPPTNVTDPICTRFSFGGSGPSPSQGNNILNVAREIDDLSLAVALFERAGLSRIFDCPGPFTVQMPVNSAVQKMDPITLDFLMQPENIADLQNLMLYHILPGSYSTLDLTPGATETLLPGEDVTVGVLPNAFNSVKVISPNIPTSNGYIHTIGSVLRYNPTDALPSPTQLPSDLAPSPTTRPTSSSPTPRPTYAPVIGTASPAQDQVDPICERFTYGGAGPEVDQEKNILEVARGIDELSLVVSLFDRAGLGRVFNCPGPFTAQFPVNSAIEALDQETLNYLTRPENLGDLQSLLLYHILEGGYNTSNLPTGTLETLVPDRDIDVTAIPPAFNSVNVVTANIPASNGYIHTVESVFRYKQLPTPLPTNRPTSRPTDKPSQRPSRRPTTPQPTPPKGSPTRNPTQEPSPSPTTSPTRIPTSVPTGRPTQGPTSAPTGTPTVTPTKLPTPPPGAPTFTPTTASPTGTPSVKPSVTASEMPTLLPSVIELPSVGPSLVPSVSNSSSLDGTNVPTLSSMPSVSVSPSVSGNPSASFGPSASNAPTVTVSLLGTGDSTGSAAPSTTGAPSSSAVPSLSSKPSLAPSISSAPSTSASPSTTSKPSLSFIPTSNIETLGPTEAPKLRIQIAEFYLAFVAKNANRAPTEAEYQELHAKSVEYFNSYFEEYYGDRTDVSFLALDAPLAFARFEAGFPEEKFNVYMQFAPGEMVYTEGSNPLNPSDSFEAIRASITTTYILDHVRKVEGSPFVSVNEVLFKAISKDGPLATDRSGSNPRSSESDIPLTTLAATSAVAALLLMCGVVVYRRNSKDPSDFTDGIYAVDHKVLEGYFSENENTNSMTEVSESNFSRFQPLPNITEEMHEDDSIHRHHHRV